MCLPLHERASFLQAEQQAVGEIARFFGGVTRYLENGPLVFHQLLGRLKTRRPSLDESLGCDSRLRGPNLPYDVDELGSDEKCGHLREENTCSPSQNQQRLHGGGAAWKSEGNGTGEDGSYSCYETGPRNRNWRGHWNPSLDLTVAPCVGDADVSDD